MVGLYDDDDDDESGATMTGDDDDGMMMMTMIARRAVRCWYVVAVGCGRQRVRQAIVWIGHGMAGWMVRTGDG